MQSEAKHLARTVATALITAARKMLRFALHDNDKTIDQNLTLYLSHENAYHLNPDCLLQRD